MPKVLRVAFSNLPAPAQEAEIIRLYGDEVEITVLAGEPHANTIADQAQRLKVDGVAFDVAPEGAIAYLQQVQPDMVVLRPIWEQQQTRDRYGNATTGRVFKAYGLVNKRNEVEPLRDHRLANDSHDEDHDQ